MADSCRFCLSKHDSINVLSYLDGKTKLRTVLSRIVGFAQPKKDTLSRNVCESCFDMCKSIFTFQQMCETTKNKLLGLPATTTTNGHHTASVPEPDDDVASDAFDSLEDLQMNSNGSSPDNNANACDKKSTLAIKLEAMDSHSPIPRRGRRSSSRHSAKKDKESFGCPHCNLYFKTQQKCEEHAKDYHNEAKDSPMAKIFVCPKCFKKFTCSEHMALHLAACSEQALDNKPFSCGRCSERFEFQAQLRDHHATVHDLDKRFSCTKCDAKFTKWAHVLLHMESVHEKKQPFACSKCGRKFAKKTNMVRHLTTHDQFKKYCCCLCNKSFRWETSLAVHLTTHSPVKQFRCTFCENAYASLSGLKKHSTVAHGQDVDPAAAATTTTMVPALESPSISRSTRTKVEKCFLFLE